MNKIAFALAALAATTLGTAAPAAVIVTNNPVAISGSSGTFSASLSGKSGSTFTDVISFLAPAGFNLQSASITSNYTGNNLKANVDFTSVLLNGVAFSLNPNGQFEFGSISNQLLKVGMNTITVSGTSGYKGVTSAAFGGTLSFGNAVPEPATWALMLLGIGGIGAGMRRRNVSALRFA